MFITFETQEAFERGCYYFPHHLDEVNREFDFVDPVQEDEKKILGTKMELRRATEPGNILWENRHTTGKEILIRSMAAGVGILIVLAMSLALFIFMMALTSVNQLKYPPDTICSDIDQLFNFDYNTDYK